jgi:hypothetical protein
MEVCTGDLALINVAAFTGSRLRSSKAIPCEVVTVEEGRLQIRTRSPYRVFTMWVDSHWIEDDARAHAV